MKYDIVERPRHYNTHPSKLECIEITRHLSFCLGNAVKYVWRYKSKRKPIEDLKKAIWYLTKEKALVQWVHDNSDYNGPPRPKLLNENTTWKQFEPAWKKFVVYLDTFESGTLKPYDILFFMELKYIFKTAYTEPWSYEYRGFNTRLLINFYESMTHWLKKEVTRLENKKQQIDIFKRSHIAKLNWSRR